MAHVLKSSKGEMGGLFRHYERAKNTNGEYIQFANQDININLSQLNYNLATHQKLTQNEFVKKRLSEVYYLKRKDVNIMCSWVVTKPKDILDSETEKFFKESYSFLENRYGKDNVISAYVHCDGTTDHMHFAFIPVVFDENKQHHKVSAKEVIHRTELQAFHKDLDKHMKNVFNRDIGVLNNATKDGNKSIQELKSEVHKNIVDRAKKQAEEVLENVEDIRIEYETKKAYVNSHIKQTAIFDGVTNKKGLLGKTKYEVTPEALEEMQSTYMDKIAVQKQQEHLELELNKISELISYKTIEKLKKELETEKQDNNKLIHTNFELLSKIDRLELQLDLLNNTIFNLPNDIRQQFSKEFDNQTELYYGESTSKSHSLSR